MKKFKIWSTIMLAVMSLSLMFACSSDNDDSNSGSSYTTDEIVEILTGKWDISGNVMITEIETGKRLGGNYTGSLEFKKDQKFDRSIKAVTEIDELSFGNENDLYYMIYSRFLDKYHGYSILRKEGKSFWVAYKKYNYEIISLTKSTFNMRLDDDFEFGEKKVHVTMTMVSK